MIDLERLRAETPGCAEVAHFNNAGCAMSPLPVLDVVIAHLQLEAEIGGYEAADAREAECAAVYTSVARLIGALPSEIALFENATLAWDMAFYSLQFRPGDRILTAQAEYGAKYVAYLQMAKRQGAVVEVIPKNASREIDPAAFDLPAYLDRIGLRVPPSATAEGLERLVRAHRLAVPFEYLDIPLGRGITLDPNPVFDKLVRRR